MGNVKIKDWKGEEKELNISDDTHAICICLEKINDKLERLNVKFSRK